MNVRTVVEILEVLEILEIFQILSGQILRKDKQNDVRTVVEIVEASEILEMFEILPDSFCWLPWWPAWPKCKEIQAKISVRRVVETLEILGCGFYTEARSIRDIRDSTGMPDYDRQNTREIERE